MGPHFTRFTQAATANDLSILPSYSGTLFGSREPPRYAVRADGVVYGYMLYMYTLYCVLRDHVRVEVYILSLIYVMSLISLIYLLV